MTDPTRAAADPAAEAETAAPRGPRGRTGAAARKGSTTIGRTSGRSTATRRPRATTTAGTAAPVNAAAPAVAGAAEASRQPLPPAQAPAPAPAPTPAAGGPLATTLTQLLAALPDADVRDLVAGYRPQRFTDDTEWAQVATLVRIGLAAVQPPSIAEAHKLGWILGVHAAIHLDAGTSRTVIGWYGPDAVEATLKSDPADWKTRSLGGHAARLRRVATTLVPDDTPAPATFGAYDPHGPYTTADLERYLDFATDHPRPEVGHRLATLIWLGVGAGPWDRELPSLTGHAFTLTEHALLAALPGDGNQVTARTVPVHHAAEAPLLTAALAAGEESLWAPMTRKVGVSNTIVRLAGLPATLPALTSGRLRATWLALVIGGGAPLTALLPAAGVKGERSFGHMVAKVAPLDPATYARALRGATGPLPTPGQQLPPGGHHPAPVVPLRQTTDTPTGRGGVR